MPRACGADGRNDRSSAGPSRVAQKGSMTSIAKIPATLLVAAVCITGLTACGGSDVATFNDSEFVSLCTKEFEKSATLKAYASDICKCEQSEMKKRGFGDKTGDEKDVAPTTEKVNALCKKQALTGS